MKDDHLILIAAGVGLLYLMTRPGGITGTTVTGTAALPASAGSLTSWLTNLFHPATTVNSVAATGVTGTGTQNGTNVQVCYDSYGNPFSMPLGSGCPTVVDYNDWINGTMNADGTPVDTSQPDNPNPVDYA